ncbi:MAG TPA: hypothetical protein VLI41_16385 [Phenylobacterium sp.]|uniref:hypothetical protein n=1 Tax=Phenylobacterium sp. TaxID=1871053 RepID=UPI002C74B4C4|nr:hypothetical protein [Phenylobacterium sp.]HSV04775.1 hypothetical protein [Phenylobacterium sp.]
MAEDDRTFRTSTPAANRAERQGLGVGQKEMNAQRAPNRDQHATDPQRLEPFDQSLEPTPGDDRGGEVTDHGAAGPSQGPGDGAQSRGVPSRERRDFAGEPGVDDRNAAGLDEAGDLGASTPAGVDIHDVGQDDNPEQDWGEDGDEAMTRSANHSRRGVKTEAERGQGKRTRQLNKDIVSRRT